MLPGRITDVLASRPSPRCSVAGLGLSTAETYCVLLVTDETSTRIWCDVSDTRSYYTKHHHLSRVESQCAPCARAQRGGTTEAKLGRLHHNGNIKNVRSIFQISDRAVYYLERGYFLCYPLE